MRTEKIELKRYKPVKSSVYTGRPQGEMVRADLKLDSKDTDENSYIFVVPSDTTSINPSFFLGMLYESLRNLGVEAFSKKYVFEFETTNEKVKNILIDNINDGVRSAKNSIERSNGTFKLF